MIAALSRFDFTLLDAARTLGCSFPAAIVRVMTPALAPAYLTAGLFAFLASMDNYPVSIFLTDARTKTLPIKMLQYIEESPDPSIAALSTLILIATLGAADDRRSRGRPASPGRTGGVADVTIALTPSSARDFLGYGRDKPAPRWPGGASVAVSVRRQFRGGRGIFDQRRRRPQRGDLRSRAPARGQARPLSRQPFRVWRARGLVARHGRARSARRQGDGQRLRPGGRAAADARARRDRARP